MLPRQLPWMESAWAQLGPLAARDVHALLLHGPRGIGKKSLALDYADFRLCASPLAPGKPCGACAECQLNRVGNHPDRRVVFPEALAGLLPHPEDAEETAAETPAAEAETTGKTAKASREIRVEQVRAISEALSITSHRGGQRIVVLAPAEALNAVAANALLKVLEEPPPEVQFVLTTDEIDDVLPTIRSRCVLLRIAAPPAAMALAWLRAQDAKVGWEDLLAAAGGAPLAALAMHEGALLPAETEQALLRLLEQGGDLSPAQIATAVPRELTLDPALRLLARWAHDLLLLQQVGQVRYHRRRASCLQGLVRQIDQRALWSWCDELKQAVAQSEHPLNARLVVESALINYARMFGKTA